MKKILLDVIRRLAFLVVTAVVWSVYLLSTPVFVLLELLFIALLMPIGWVLVGSEKLDKVFSALFIHSTEELWYREHYDPNLGYFSLFPTWARWLQKHYINRILPKEDLD